MRYLDSKIHLPLLMVNEDLQENIFSDDIKLKEDLRGSERTIKWLGLKICKGLWEN